MFVLIFWQAMAPAQQFDGNGQIIRADRGRPPEAVAYLNPFLAQVDVLCGTEATFGGWCSLRELPPADPEQGPVFEGGRRPGADAADRSDRT